jgi:pyruvate formate lyase activating enzyme
MATMDRRTFITAGAAWLGCAASAQAFWPFGRRSEANMPEEIRWRVFKGDAPRQLWPWSHEAYRYEKMGEGRVVCGVCPHRCLLSPGDRSVCRSKVNLGGTLYTLAYGNPCAVHIDPMEKKPLYHFMPGLRVYSLAAAGCNFRCLNCQNWEISQFTPEQVRHEPLAPEAAVAAAAKAGCRAIAYTYSEPITFIEYMTAIARPAKAVGIKNLLISNGYINPEPLADLCSLVDGANINLKAFSDDIYRTLNGGRLAPVLATLQTLHARGVHLEITHLVVPGYTDDLSMVAAMCRWMVETLGPDHPVHFLRFFPQYKLDRLAATPISTLERCREIARGGGLRYVYLGNVPGHAANHTYCPGCGRLVIERRGYELPQYHLKGDGCAFCGAKIAGVWDGRMEEKKNEVES